LIGTVRLLFVYDVLVIEEIQDTGNKSVISNDAKGELVDGEELSGSKGIHNETHFHSFCPSCVWKQ